MVEQGIQAIDNGDFDLLVIENVGNLVCPAEFDTGAHRNIMILSVPEGDDKPLKYPLMFSCAMSCS
jgi:hydrogenase nickel incorporation protein HypB